MMEQRNDLIALTFREVDPMRIVLTYAGNITRIINNSVDQLATMD